MKTVICGLWHVHAGQYFRVASKHTEVLGVWDSDPKRLENFCKRFETKAFASMEELLASGADAAIVCTSSDTHKETIVRLADAKMDIFTEKVLALTTPECEEIEEAIHRNGVKFAISLFHKFSAGAIAAKKIVDSGELGKINFVRYRNVHNGSTGNWLPPHFYDAKECGGGAMIDLGAHGMYMIDWLVGMPIAAKSVFTNACDDEAVKKINPDGVEDNAVTVLQYANGCIAINETGFDSVGYPVILEVGGEKGRLYFDEKKLIKYTSTDDKTVEVELGEDQPIPVEQFCMGQIPEGCGLAEAKNLTRLMEMAYGRI